MPKVTLSVVLFFCINNALLAEQSKEGSYLYRVTTVRAAPGKLDELIELLKSSEASRVYETDGFPFILRHTQGDHWDLMLIHPMGSFAKYYSPEANTKRHRLHKLAVNLQDQLDQLIAFNEDTFAIGANHDVLQVAFADHDFYHVEMFHALPGKHAELFEQRRMENAYLKATGQTDNFIFEGIGGSDVDVFTIGFYPNMVAFAQSAPTSEEQAEVEAKKAGFEARAAIGTYLRSLIHRHYDTLAVAVD